jgi:hypothetical protein
MKTGITSISKLVKSLGLLMISMSVQAQTGKVWLTVAEPSALGLKVESGQLTSNVSSLNNLFNTLNVFSMEQAFPASRRGSLSNVYEITCGCDANVLLQEVAKQGTYFSKPEIVESFDALFTPNDFNLAVSNDYALSLINARDAWDITRGDSSIVIAITDGNFQLNHEELVGKYNYVSPNTSTDYSHGTAVAISAAGNTNNAMGKSSIGYNSSLQLRAMNYNEVLSASYSGARVINMSWSSGCFYNIYAQQVIDEAYANGSILVASAGNGSTCGGASNLVYPAAYNNVIAVSSVGPNDNHERYIGNTSSTHQHNASVDICAPGYDVALSTAPGVYLTGNGTSFAAPLVSGTIALMLSANACLSASEVEYILKNTAVNIDAMNPQYVGMLGAGRLNAAAAVQMASTYSTMYLGGAETFNCEDMSQGAMVELADVAAPYTVSWSNGATTASIDDLNVGVYTAIVRDSNGCVGTFVATIDTLMPITINADIMPVLCHGENTGNIEVSVTGGHGFNSYAWSNGATTSNIYGLSIGTYSLTVTDGKGCAATSQFEVLQPDTLVANIGHQNQIFYTNGNVDVTVLGGSLPYTYSWNNGQTTEDLNNVAAGFYEVLITDANGCLTSANATVGQTQVTEVENNFGFGQQEGTAGITETTTATTFNVYPNPAVSNATITWNNNDVTEVQLLDLTGKVINTYKVDGYTQEVALQNIAQGEYMVNTITDKGTITTQKVIFL